MEEKDFVLFDNYLQGDLSEDEVLAFKNRLESDGDFKKQFMTYKALSGYLEHTLSPEASAFTQNLEQISQAHFSASEERVDKPDRKGFNYARLAIAASVAFLIGIFLFNQIKTASYTDFNTHEPIELTLRAGNVKDLVEATKAFNNKDYAKANAILEGLLVDDPENVQLQLYFAITNIELDQFDRADAMLNTISQGKSVYKYRAIWYKALSALKQGETEEVKALLKQLPEEADDYEQARRLLNKLD